MADPIRIALNRGGRMSIVSPFRYNHLIKALPARFSKTTSKWSAPILRGTVNKVRALQRNPAIVVEIDPAAEAEFQRIENGLKIREEKFPIGYKFKLPPMPHQQAGLDFVWPRRAAALGMEMGTGKTKITVDIISARFLGGQINQVLVFAPASILSTWAEEIVKHCPLAARIYYDIPPAQDPGVLRIWLTSTEGMGISLKRYEEVISFLERPGAKTLGVVDESSFIKEHKNTRCERIHKIGRVCDYRMILNGTLIGNTPLDLWSQFEFLDPNIIGQPWYDFRAYYSVTGGFEGRQVLAHQNLEELFEAVAPWTFIVKKKDVMKDLPPKMYERRDIKPSAEQLGVLKAMKEKPLHITLPPEMGVAGSVKTQMVLERILRQRQLSAGFVTYIPEGAVPDEKGRWPSKVHRLSSSPKTDELMVVIGQAPGKVVVWCSFTEEIMMIRDRIAEEYGTKSVVVFHGGMSDDEKDESRHRLQDDPTCKYFVGNVAAGAMGITLTAADTEVYHSETFSYLQRAQSEDRCHRKGQINSVKIIDLVVSKTADELCYEAQLNKKDLAEYVDESIDAARLRQLNLE